MIGAIADDFTGATDVAVAFRRAGLRTVVLFRQPSESAAVPEADAIVIGLKTRTVPAASAVAESIAAVTWLQGRGAGQFYFKYCSTFDSRADGNIGPVADAMAEHLGARQVAVAPSSPQHGRTQYRGHLFVGDQLLSESPMRHHPLTPMKDSYIPRVLAAQTTRRVDLIRLATVSAGRKSILRALDQLDDGKASYVVIDAIHDDDLTKIGAALSGKVLVTGAAGLAGGLGRAIASTRSGADVPVIDADPVGAVRSAALAGSCSARTLQQVAHMSSVQPAYFLDAVQDADAHSLAAAALDWYDAQDSAASPLIYSSVSPEGLRRVHEVLGTHHASRILETAMGLIARGLVARNVRRLVVAGGETSGAVVSALDIEGGLIGDEAAPGVPWIYTIAERPIALLLKSGNFGEPNLLTNSVRSSMAEKLSG